MKPVKPYSQEGSKKAQVASMFNAIAKRYDLLNRTLSLGIDVIWRNITVKAVGKHQPIDLLDVATGTGDLAIALSHIPNSHIYGIDIAQSMLAVAQVKIEKKHLDDRITLSHGDGESLPYKDASYDAVTVAFGVRNFENLMPGLKEMRRVLRPDGQIAILEFSQPERFPIKQIYHVYFKVILPVIGRLVSKDNAAYTYLPESVDAFPYGQTFLDKLQEAGFRDLHHRPLTFGIATLYTAKK